MSKKLDVGGARGALHRAVKLGKVVPPGSCADCGKVGRVEGHHHDYSRPLDVVWLCKGCHSARHRGPKRKTISMAFDQQFLDLVDERKGGVSRTRFVERALEMAMGVPEGTARSAPSPGMPVTPPAAHGQRPSQCVRCGRLTRDYDSMDYSGAQPVCAGGCEAASVPNVPVPASRERPLRPRVDRDVEGTPLPSIAPRRW